MSVETVATIVLLILFFTSALLPGRNDNSIGWMSRLLRPFFPSWRFFEDVTEVPVMFYRVAPVDGEFGPWLPAIKILPRRWYSLLINPECNFSLAANSLLQQLEIELGELSPDRAETFENSVAFELSKNMACFLVAEESQKNCLARPARLQFKIGRVLQGTQIEDLKPFLQSRVIQL